MDSTGEMLFIFCNSQILLIFPAQPRFPSVATKKFDFLHVQWTIYPLLQRGCVLSLRNCSVCTAFLCLCHGYSLVWLQGRITGLWDSSGGRQEALFKLNYGRSIESLRLEKSSKIIKFKRQPSTTMSAKPYPRVPYLHFFFNTSRDGDSTTSLGSLFQCFTTLSVKKFFLISNLNLP